MHISILCILCSTYSCMKFKPSYLVRCHFLLRDTYISSIITVSDYFAAFFSRKQFFQITPCYRLKGQPRVRRYLRELPQHIAKLFFKNRFPLGSKHAVVVSEQLFYFFYHFSRLARKSKRRIPKLPAMLLIRGCFPRLFLVFLKCHIW